MKYCSDVIFLVVHVRIQRGIYTRFSHGHQLYSLRGISPVKGMQ